MTLTRSVSAQRLRRVGAIALALLPLLLSTCRLDNLFQSRAPEVVITLAGDTVAVLDSVTLEHTVTVDGDPPKTALPLTWRSSNTDVAAVDSTSGVVRGRARGTTIISVRLAPSALGEVSAEGRDTVLVIAASVTLAPGDTSMQSVGDTLCYRTTARDAAGGTIAGAIPGLRIVTDADATVQLAGTTGCVVALRAGAAATIEASLDTSRATGSLTVRQRVTSLEIAVESDTLLGLGSTETYPATGRDARGNLAPAATITWTSSDAAVVTVDATGRATAQGEGTAYVRARADDGADSVSVTVIPIRTNPSDPTTLGQFLTGGTPITVGADISETAVQFRGTVSDIDAGDRLRLEVELKPVGTAFDGAGTVVSADVATAQEATLTISGIPDDANYHWRARTRDQTDRTSAWVNFGGNSESQADFHIPPVAEAPDAPTDPAQYQSDGTTAIAVGGIAFQSTVVLKGRLTDADPGDQLTLEVEVRPVGTPLTNAATHTSAAVASGSVATITVAGLNEDTEYHWQFRIVDQTSRTSPWTGFGANAESAADFRVALPEPPNAPTGLGQFRSDGSTAITVGATIDERTVVFKATVTDPDPGDQIRLEVEIKPLGTALDGAGTSLGAGMASGAVAGVTVGSQSDNTSYHWRVRSVDQTSRTSAWVSFGANAESDIDYRIVMPEPPASPASLAQSKSNGTTAIASGATTDEATVVFQAAISDPDPTDQVRLDLEVRPVVQSFTGTPTHSGALGAAGTAQVSVSGLSDNTDYHWRARARDQSDGVSAWVSFGGTDGTTDFRVAVPENPGSPSGLGQFQSNGTTAIAAGATTTENTVVFKATVTDVDPGDQIRLEVEVQPVGTAFTNAPTATGGTSVSSGAEASVTVSPLSDNTDYHWQVRAVDQVGRTGGWVAFGSGGTDFHVSVLGAPDAPSALQQYKSDGSTVIAGGATTNEKTVVFKATVSDAGDPLDQVRLEVEIKPAGTGFTGSNTTVSAAGGNPSTATVTVSNLGDDTDYHWRARTLDPGNNASAWVEFPTGGTDFRVKVPEAPAVPSSLAQFESNGTTPIALGGDNLTTSVALQAAISDVDPGDQVRLDLEVRPIAQAFTGTPTHSSALGAGGTVQISVSGLSDDTEYHWRARARDQSDSVSAWTSFGANADGARDFRIAVPQPPAAPTGLAQFKSDGTTPIATGDPTNESTVVLKATIGDPDPGDQVRLDLEVRLVGESFTGTPTHFGSLGAGGSAQVSVSSLLDDTNYHWRARTRDQSDGVSAWVSFPESGNAETDTDFRIAVPQDPDAPTGLAQFKSDGTTPIAVGAITDQTTVVFKATLTDPDAGAQLKLEIERKVVGTDFNGLNTDSSAAVASGTATITKADHIENAGYHWRARTVDETGRASAWVSFDVNAENASDFLINATPENPNDATGEGQFRGDSATAIGIGAVTTETVVVFKAAVSDPDPGSTLRIEVERKATSAAFDGIGTDTLAVGVPNGGQAVLRRGGQTDNTAYHWRVRALDETGRPSAGWASFGGNAETAADYRIDTTPEAPNAPTGLDQFQSNGTMQIALGGAANQTTVVFKATVSDPDPGELVRLQVEVQETGVAFTNSPSATSTVAVQSASIASVTVGPLVDEKNYHWQARTIDAANSTSAWVSFGGNPEPGGVDFQLPGVPEPPGPPTVLGQFKMDASTAIALNARTDQDTVVFKATVTDADLGAMVRLEVEVKPLGTAFTGTGTVVGVTAVATGNIAQVSVPDLTDNTSYHWRARAHDEADSLGPWVSFPEAGNAESDADFHVDQVAQSPADPTAAGQFKSNGSTTITTGVTTDQNTVVFKATVSDADPADTLKLQVEVQPLGTGFTNSPTATSSTGVLTGQVASVTVGSQTDNTSYHWQVRTIDRNGQTGNWVPFAGNAETDIDYRIEVPEPPVAPASLAQFKSNGSTSIGTGASTDESTVVLQAAISDPDPGQQVRLDLEVRPIGTSFTGTPTHSGALGAGGTVQVTVSSLTDDTNYHWRARSRDQSDSASAWVSFGGNADGVTDFGVAVPQAPPVPADSALKQLKSFGASAIPVSDTTRTDSIVFRARLTDPDPGAQVRFQVEWQLVGTAFDGSGTIPSAAVASGDTAIITVTGLADNAAYHWRVRALDQSDSASAWVSFGGNADPGDADFRVWIPENPSAPSGPDQFKSNGTTTIPVAGSTDETTVVFKATLNDVDPGDSLRLEVERQPVGTPFTNVATAISSPVVPAQQASVTVSVHNDNTSYHWQVRTADKTGRKSLWVSFGGNADPSDADYRVNTAPENPAAPSTLGQFQVNGTTSISVGGNAAGLTVVLKGTLTDADPGDELKLEVEVKSVLAGFDGIGTTLSSAVTSGSEATATVTVLAGDQHWRARTCDQTSRCSTWVSFGGNSDGSPPLTPAAIDFKAP